MKVKEIMTPDPGCCTPGTTVRDVARLMVECDCGEIPVIADRESRKLAGVVTDRDIVCRVVAAGIDASTATARDCMSTTVISVTPETEVDECCRLMERYRVRRLPIVDAAGACCGIVSQADIVRGTPEAAAAEVVRAVSRPSG